MSDDSAVEAARRILAIDSDHIDSVDAIAVADAYLSSQSQVERMREALEKAEDALARAGYGHATSTETMQAAREARSSRLAALSPKEEK